MIYFKGVEGKLRNSFFNLHLAISCCAVNNPKKATSTNEK